MQVVITGHSKSGKKVLKKECEKQGLDKVVQYTTNKKSNESFNNVTKDEFIESIRKKEFIEYEVIEGDYYGIKKKDITENCVIVVGPEGLEKMREIYGRNVFSIFLELTEGERVIRFRERYKDKSLKEISEITLVERRKYTEDIKESVDMRIVDIDVKNITEIVSGNIKKWLGGI